MTKHNPTLEDRLHSKLKARPSPDFLHGPCQVFQGGKLNKAGHGGIRDAGKMKYAHRVAWEAVHGPIPIDQRTGKPFVILHLCDNPACCNVNHMALGSQQENNQDCIAKGRHHIHSATMNKLTKAVELAASGMSAHDIAEELNVSPDEVERLLEFHVEDASIYAAEQIVFGHDAAEQMRRYRLIASYEAVIAVTEMMAASSSASAAPVASFSGG